jgi:SAM-dependent methyltransferase
MVTMQRETGDHSHLARRKLALPNLFANLEVAARYRRIRPFFHHKITSEIREFSGLQGFRRVLDVGCGTGQSSVALAEIAETVIAIDSAPEMLHHALLRPNIEYRQGMAEQLDFADGEFDLVSVGSALHWFDQRRFFPQCRRVLNESGLLAVYNDHFTTHMEGIPDFSRWMRSRFAKRFRTRRRGISDIDLDQAMAAGFRVAHRSCFNHLVAFSREELITYLLTQTRTLAASHRNQEPAPAMSAWLREELDPFLPAGVTGTLIFKCNFWLLSKQ